MPMQRTGHVWLVTLATTLSALGLACGEARAVGGQVRHVATTGSNAGNDCLTSSAPCLTINWAIGQADPDDVIRVAAGTYPEEVVVTKPLMLRGAQFGVNAPTRSVPESQESATASRTTSSGLFRVFSG